MQNGISDAIFHENYAENLKSGISDAIISRKVALVMPFLEREYTICHSFQDFLKTPHKAFFFLAPVAQENPR